MSEKGHNRAPWSFLSLGTPLLLPHLKQALVGMEEWPLGLSAAPLNPHTPWGLLNPMLWASRMENANGLRRARCSGTTSPHTSSIVSSDITSDLNKLMRLQDSDRRGLLHVGPCVTDCQVTYHGGGPAHGRCFTQHHRKGRHWRWHRFESPSVKLLGVLQSTFQNPCCPYPSPSLRCSSPSLVSSCHTWWQEV